MNILDHLKKRIVHTISLLEKILTSSLVTQHILKLYYSSMLDALLFSPIGICRSHYACPLHGLPPKNFSHNGKTNDHKL